MKPIAPPPIAATLDAAAPASPDAAAAAPAARLPARAWVFDFILLAAIWGGSFMFTRTSSLAFGPLSTVGLRVGIASLFLLPLLITRGHWPALRAHWKLCFVVGLLNSALPFACLAWALLSIPTGLAALLNATVPLFGASIAWWWLGDRLQGSRVLGLLVGFAGVALLALYRTPSAAGNTDTNFLAVLACLAACFFYGVAASFTRRFLTNVPSMVLATGSQLGATLALLPLAVWTWPSTTAPLQAWGAVLVLGVICTGLAYVLFFRLIERTGPSRALSVTYAIPVFAIVYGVVLLGETVTLWMGGCAIIIMLGTALSTGLIGWGKQPGRQ